MFEYKLYMLLLAYNFDPSELNFGHPPRIVNTLPPFFGKYRALATPFEHDEIKSLLPVNTIQIQFSHKSINSREIFLSTQ